jgi:hypothetical protein
MPRINALSSGENKEAMKRNGKRITEFMNIKMYRVIERKNEKM